MCNQVLRITICGLIGLTATAGALAADVTIDEDTTIDAGSSISGSSIEVIDGADGSTRVDIVTGGIVAGFGGRDSSTIALDGGTVTYLSSLEDNATFIMRVGTIECSEPICSVIDYSTLFQANDSSSLHFYGGMLDGIELNDSSVAHVYGKNLSLVIVDQIAAYVEGTYSNGEPVNVSFHFRPDIASRVVLHAVPEPCGSTALLTAISALLLLRRDRKHSLG